MKDCHTKHALKTGIGMDYGTLLVRRLGLRGTRQNEVWAGKPANMAAKGIVYETITVLDLTKSAGNHKTIKRHPHQGRMPQEEDEENNHTDREQPMTALESRPPATASDVEGAARADVDHQWAPESLDFHAGTTRQEFGATLIDDTPGQPDKPSTINLRQFAGDDHLVRGPPNMW
jgi:hypothetical protein